MAPLLKDYLAKVETDYNADFIFDETEVGTFALNGITAPRELLNYLLEYFDQFGQRIVLVKPNVAIIVTS